MSYKYHHLLRPFTLSLLIFLVSACEDQNTDVENSPSNLKEYKHNGVELVHPEDWSLDRDGMSFLADRKVSIETTNLSEISIYFCITDPCSIKTIDPAHKFPRFPNVDRKKVNISGYEGLQLNWTDTGLSDEDIKIEATFLLFQKKPYPILVEIYLYDDDIINQKANIIPILESISISIDTAEVKRMAEIDKEEGRKLIEMGAKRYIESLYR